MYFHTIYCDQDGITADFHTEAVRAHMRVGRRYPSLSHSGTPLQLSGEYLRSRWPLGVSCHIFTCPELNEVKDYWDDEMDTFWKPIREDPLFWHNLPVFPWTFELVKLLKNHCKHLVFVTTPDKDTSSYAGKYAWLRRHGLDNHELITMKQKWRLARPDALIIDDFHVHVNNWHKECQELFNVHGHALLFPQPWNPNHHASRDPMNFIRHYLATKPQ